MIQAKPITEWHSGICVVRDDLFPGGTKARFIPALFEGVGEVVYASPCEGGAQFSIATVARALGKRATIFCAARGQAHARLRQVEALGAKVVQIRPGYLSTVQNRARTYASVARARLAPFGLDLPIARAAIAAAAAMIAIRPDEVWCAAGSGTLARGLAAAWPGVPIHAVRVGRQLNLPADIRVHNYPAPFDAIAPSAPFPSDQHYDAKAWRLCIEQARPRPDHIVLFWNVLGPAQLRA